MQRISVDLPEPEGPQMTIFSPLATVRLMSLKTWKAPNHLPTPIIWIAALRAPVRGTPFCPLSAGDPESSAMPEYGCRQRGKQRVRGAWPARPIATTW